jgi:hypothetical protein
MCGSTCFGRLPNHRQQHTIAVGASGFTVGGKRLELCWSWSGRFLDVYIWLNMFRGSPRPSSGAYNCTRSLWFYRWWEVAGALLVVVWQVSARPRPTTLQPLPSNGKNQRLLVQLSPDDRRGDARNMLSHT